MTGASMPLFEMSPNVQEADAAGRKRSHDEFAGDLLKVEDGAETKTPKATITRPAGDSLLPLHVHPDVERLPIGLDSPARTEAGTTPACDSPPQTPTKTMSPKSPKSSKSLIGNKNPIAKRKRLTAEEKETKERELAEKKKEREEQATKKAFEKAKQEEEKAARVKEREEKRKQKEEEERLRAEQRAEKKQKKEEEQRRIQEEKEKKARSQSKLNAFFAIPSNSKKADPDYTSVSGSPVKAQGTIALPKPAETEYDRLFKPFFVRENTRLAPCVAQMDLETKDAKSRILDDLITKQHDGEEHTVPRFDAVEHLCLPFRPMKRGKSHHPVKHIMETAYRKAESSSSASAGGAADHIFKEARKRLASIPQKVIAFSQDVRPPYYGTITLKPFALGRDTMNRLARKPMDRRFPLDYDYDSEAEWQEEEGEDIDMDDDDQEELDDEDDMDGFLDDTEDTGLSRRVFGSAMEPECTGICFENHHRLGPNRAAYEHKMEFMHEGLEHTWGIDPFSSQYWDPEPKGKPGKATAALGSLATSSPAIWTTAKMPPPPTPANAFAALNGEASTSSTTVATAKLVRAELMNDVKQAILDNKALSKVGIIDFIFHQFRDNVSRAEVKNTLEHVAEKKGVGRSKEWDLKPGHEIVL